MSEPIPRCEGCGCRLAYEHSIGEIGCRVCDDIKIPCPPLIPVDKRVDALVLSISIATVDLLEASITDSKTRGVDRATVDWLVGDHVKAGAALTRVQQRNKKLQCRRRKSLPENWYFRT